MKLQSVNVHPDSLVQAQEALHVDGHPLRHEAAGTVTVYSGGVEDEPTTFRPQIMRDRAGQRVSKMLAGVPAAYADMGAGPLRAAPDTHGRGVYRSDDGRAYIKQGDQVYPVRYDKDNATWRAVSPDNPAKYAYPVRQDVSGDWHTHGDVGMQGGRKGNQSSAGVGQPHRVTELQQHIENLQTTGQEIQSHLQGLQSELQQFPGPLQDHVSQEELAHLQGMLQSEVGNLQNQLHAVEQQIQQASQQLTQLQNDL